MKNLSEVLQGAGLSIETSLAYEAHLRQQIQGDTEHIRQKLAENLSKNTRKMHESSIVYYLQPKTIVLNENGYPASWD